jgi:hypothetical protein
MGWAAWDGEGAAVVEEAMAAQTKSTATAMSNRGLDVVWMSTMFDQGPYSPPWLVSVLLGAMVM